MKTYIFVSIFALLAVFFSVVSVMSFLEKGFLFNNAWIWASNQEREAMDKKPHYRQSAIGFALCAAEFWIMALECVLSTGWLWVLVILLGIGLLVYAVVSEKRK